MDGKWIPYLVGLFLFIPALLAPPVAAEPNVVLVVADDLGIGDVSYSNTGGLIQTPNIDRLARGGRIYLDARAPGSVCTPTRYGLLVGRHAWRTWMQRGVMMPYGSTLIEPWRVTMPKWFKWQGYTTAAVGKWHLGFDWRRKDGSVAPAHMRRRDESTIDLSRPYANGPLDAGFHSFFGVDAPNYPPYAFIANRRIHGPVPTQAKPPHEYGLPGLAQPGWDVDQTFARLAHASISKLAALAKEDRPFFLYLPLTAPHTPITPGPNFRGKSACGPYCDFVLEIDAFMGRLERVLRRHGKLHNTILIFTSDNGSPGRYDTYEPAESIIERSGHRPNGNLGGFKASPYEGGHRVPLFLHWSAGGARGASDLPVSLIQLWPTLADLIGKPLAAPAFAPDAWSFASDLDPSIAQRRTDLANSGLYGTSFDGIRSIRWQKWKLVWSLDGFLLHDLSEDPEEQVNLAARRPALVERLSQQMVQIMARQGD